jgi:ABC-type multidrug transport system fused ATPase/permease subunit
MQRFHERSRRAVRRELQVWLIGSLGFHLAGALLTVGAAVSLGLGGYLFLSGAITLGSVYLIFAYTQLLNRPLEQISRQLQDLQQAGAGLRRIQQLLAQKSALVDGIIDLPSGPLRVQLEDVSFGYVADEPVIRQLAFTLEPGTVLGVLGRTGIGKSTLAKLLVRVHDPQVGRICLGGVDVRHARRDSLRRCVGLVTQEIQIFHASVRDNLSLFDPTLSDARMLDVLHELGLDDWLGRLPSGLDTRLEPTSAGMSAGEAQLLAFARVFLRNPGLVILAEASSRLDPGTERLLERAVDGLLAERTAILIAHRLSTLERADDIAIVEDGRIVEHGPRAMLAADSRSRFRALLDGRTSVPLLELATSGGMYVG